MLASPLMPQPPAFSLPYTSDDARQYLPARDIEAFNKLLPPPIEFVEGSSSGALAVPEGKYEAINATPNLPQSERHASSSSAVASSPSKPPKSTPKPASKGTKLTHLHSGDFDMSWPDKFDIAAGFFNNGNTCFLNSVLQCLVHIPPLLKILVAHTNCDIATFCMACSLKVVAIRSHLSGKPSSPSVISGKLHVIAKNMRKGRQEDSHEFLRYAIEALQKSSLAGHPPKLDPKIAETSWVHKLFGGQLRSRVTCQSCGHNSDTFDRIMDLSVDIHNVNSVRDALRKFVAPDHLRGSDKYKCEKCQKPVNAEKRFTVNEAPRVLTIHLKRFSHTGRKVANQVNFDDQLTLQPYMSDGQHGPTYSLSGVICHAGGGPNSGHYYAFVKSKKGLWFEMNDESTSSSRTPLNHKNAYLLFYLLNKGQRLESALNSTVPASTNKPRLADGMKKRKASVEQEDAGVSVSKPFIGPVLPGSVSLTPTPSPAKRQKLEDADPQADVIKRKIESVTSSKYNGLSALNGYGSDGDSKENAKEPASTPAQVAANPTPTPNTNRPPISPSTFYGTKNAGPWKPKKHSMDPFSRRLTPTTYANNKRRRGNRPL